MLSLKSKDPLDALVAEVEKVLSERADVLAVIAKAEAKQSECEAELAAARERIAHEEYQAAQVEGGLAVASKAAQQRLAEAELQSKSARFRIRGVRDRMGAIEQRLMAAWAAVLRYRQEFTLGKIEALGQDWDEALTGLVRLVCKARALQFFIPRALPRGLFHPASALAQIIVPNPFTRQWYIQGEFIRNGERMVSSKHHLELSPEGSALHDELQTLKERITGLAGTLKEAGVSGIDLKPQGGEEGPEKPVDDGAVRD